MAILYPEKPKEFSKYSREDIMFDALSKLPDDYYIFHSFSIVNVKNNNMQESETDFVVFNPNKGILCIEAKAGNVKYENGEWKYGSGIVMSHDGPFNQASTNKYKLINYFKFKGYGNLLNKCKFLHAVWFPSISIEKVNNIELPSEGDKHLILTSESLDNIENDISKIFDVVLPNNVRTSLNNNDIEIILNRILAPKFNLVSIAEIDVDHKRMVFKKMLSEQIALLNYLEEQHEAIINGMAGTGKTVMAIEKAKRHADKNEKVLFLCYNYYLKEYLKNNYANQYIDYYTIDGLTCDMCKISKADYSILKDYLTETYINSSFPYKHIIIDEGQDFGKSDLDEVNIIELLKENVLHNDDGTFYMFYDKNQMIQSKDAPNYIKDADCKLTLYKNCRNTINIARTSLRLLGSDKAPTMYEGAIYGESPRMYFCNDRVDSINKLNQIIDEINEQAIKNIQILTCKTEETSILKDDCLGGNYFYKSKKIPFTTCRKFKGLEAEVVILVDVDKSIYEQEMELISYVGSSRAKFELNIIANISEEDANILVDKYDIKAGKKVFKSLATLFNSRYIEK